MRILNHTQNSILAHDVNIADHFISRMTGLLNRSHFFSGQALVITRCQQIHMFFMRFAIDVIFVDPKNCVVGLVENIKPFAMSRIFWQADRAIELPSGTIAQSQTSLGDTIQFLS